MTIPVLIISGPVGVGKTTIGEEVSNILMARGIPHSLIDMDCLAETYPRADRFGTQLALKNLRDVWANCIEAGSRNLILPRVIESREDLESIRQAIPNAAPIVCRLRAGDNTLIERVTKREIGSGLDWHQRRSLELAKILDHDAPTDFVVETDNRSIIEIAEDIVGKVEWVF